MTIRRFLMLILANMFVSGFCGLMGALFFSTFSTDWVWQSIAAGVFGFVGVQSLDIITLTMNKIRQAKITTEIIEVVSGAESLG